MVQAFLKLKLVSIQLGLFNFLAHKGVLKLFGFPIFFLGTLYVRTRLDIYVILIIIVQRKYFTILLCKMCWQSKLKNLYTHVPSKYVNFQPLYKMADFLYSIYNYKTSIFTKQKKNKQTNKTQNKNSIYYLYLLINNR